MCAGGRGVHKFMWMSQSEGEGSYVQREERVYINVSE